MRPLIPRQLELDLHQSQAWVGLVPFAIESPRPFPSFFETNVRTYVMDAGGNRGVWFFSLDAASLAAVMGARIAYALPYFWANMKLHRQANTVQYQSRRRAPHRPHCNLELEIGDPIPNPTELDLFLTARYRLYANRAGRLRQAEIEHPPWPLQTATVSHLRQTLVEAAGLPTPQGNPLAHFSNRVEVKIGPPRLLR